jgi:AcrR family transcriptional regulator
MGRPKSYDYDKVIKQAMLQFWCNGYAETSLSDLEAATAVNRYSLYKGFGDKEQIFELTLNYYYQYIIEVMLAPLRSSSPNLKNLKEFFLQLNTLLKGKYGAYGCLIQNSQKEGISKNDLVKHHGAQLWRTQHTLISVCIDNSNTNLPFSKEVGIQLLLAQFQSQVSLARSSAPKRLLDDQCDATLTLISSWEV